MAVRQQMHQWFSEPLGRDLLSLEQDRVDEALSNLFGYHLVQIGCLNGRDFLKNSRILFKTILKLQEDEDIECSDCVICSSESLAIASDSIDLVFTPHVLEYAASPHKLLREIERVLIGDGHLVLVGYNPWSFWGLWRLVLAWRKIPPWYGHFYGLMRIRDWLSLLDFEIVKVERIFFRPPINNTMVMHKLKFLEKLGKYCWPIFGGVYIIVAKKRIIPLTPIKIRWLDRRKVIASGVIEPGTN